MRCGRAGSLTSQSRMSRSALPTASTCPSGLNATEYAVLVGPVSALPSFTGVAGSVTFHSRTSSSALAAASRSPWWLNATENTAVTESPG